MTYFFRSFLITAAHWLTPPAVYSRAAEHSVGTLCVAGVILFLAMLPTPLRAQGLGTFSAFRISVVSEEDSDTPTKVTSNSADIDLAKNIITLIGSVKVDDGQSVISCNKMEIYLDEDAAGTFVGEAEKPADPGSAAENAEMEKHGSAEAGAGSEDEDEDEDAKNIKKIVCIGDVIFRKLADKNDPDGQDQIAMSGNAEYDVGKEIVVMTGAHSDPAGALPEGVYESMGKYVRGNIIESHPVMMQGETWVIGESFTVFIKENNRLKVKDMIFHYTGTSLFEAEPGNEEDENDEKVTDALISTRDADIDLENDLITLVGDVDVDEESNKITCNKMVISLKEKKPAADGKTETAADSNDIGGGKDVSKIVCTGDVVFLKRSDPDAPAGDNQIAMSDKADYDAEKEILEMTGKPVMMQGSNRLYGSRIKVFLKEDNRMEVDTAKAQLAGKLLSSDDDQDATGLALTAITAKKADIRQNEKITLSQNVVVDDGSGQITCGKMEIFMQKDSSNPLFDISNRTKSETADKKGNNELGNDVSKIICTGNVVYRKMAGEGGTKQVVLAREAHYDASTEEIEMIGAHSSPQGEIPQNTYDEIIRSIGKNGTDGKSAGDSTEPYSIMMQDSNWIAGSPIKIFPKEGNRITVKYMKAGLRQSSRSTASKEEKN
jgi:lipopolysaccharide export system protein LptA